MSSFTRKLRRSGKSSVAYGFATAAGTYAASGSVILSATAAVVPTIANVIAQTVSGEGQTETIHKNTMGANLTASRSLFRKQLTRHAFAIVASLGAVSYAPSIAEAIQAPTPQASMSSSPQPLVS